MTSKSKIKIINLVGHIIEGEVNVTFWNDELGSFVMDNVWIPIGTPITKKLLVSSINDGRYGVKSIDRAFITIWEKWDDHTSNLVKEMEIDMKWYDGKKGI